MAEETLGSGLTERQVRVRQQLLSVQEIMQRHCAHNFYDPRRHRGRCPQCGGAVTFECS